MKYTISIKRQEFQDYTYESDGEESVATMLERLNGTLKDPISWQCSCMQKKCGACAMVINGRPRLACNTFLKDMGPRIKLEPLSKFPVVKDLTVDRGYIFDMMKKQQIWLEDNDLNVTDHASQRFAAASCLMCGCCLEVCPNFSVTLNHIGAIGTVAGYRAEAAERDQSARAAKKQAYQHNVYNTCGKSLSCMDICPMKLPVEELMVRLNKRE